MALRRSCDQRPASRSSSTVLMLRNASASSSNATSTASSVAYQASILRPPPSRKRVRCAFTPRRTSANTGCGWSKVRATARSAPFACSAAAIAAFEKDLRTHAVKVLLYNTQTGQALAERMRTIANHAGVPVVAITETEPEGKRYQEWMLSQLDALDRALGGR